MPTKPKKKCTIAPRTDMLSQRMPPREIIIESLKERGVLKFRSEDVIRFYEELAALIEKRTITVEQLGEAWKTARTNSNLDPRTALDLESYDLQKVSYAIAPTLAPSIHLYMSSS
jgi:hypothetical protein